VGLRENAQITTYTELNDLIDNHLYGFDAGNEWSPSTRRSEFKLRLSGIDQEELKTGLLLLGRMVRSNDLTLQNLPRIQDLVKAKIANNDKYTHQWESNWVKNPAKAFWYQTDAVGIAIGSAFTQAHWAEQMRWTLHDPVPSLLVDQLNKFSNETISGMDEESCKERKAFEALVKHVSAEALKSELVAYWVKNLSHFAPGECKEGLRQLSLEAVAGLRSGPEITLKELRELQRYVVSRAHVRVRVMATQKIYRAVKNQISVFLKSIPSGKTENRPTVLSLDPFIQKLKRRYSDFNSTAPAQIGFVYNEGTTANLVFYSTFSGLKQRSPEHIKRVIASKLMSGGGPHTFYMRTWEAGLAYSNGVNSDLRDGLLSYYADRVPSVPSLVKLIEGLGISMASLNDRSYLNYSISQMFKSREMLPFIERARLLDTDLQDGITLSDYRKYFSSVLKMTKDPSLWDEIRQLTGQAIAPVMVGANCGDCQTRQRSLFFIVGPDKQLNDAAAVFPGQRLFKLWRSDFWLP
jgi:hypothetical protein